MKKIIALASVVFCLASLVSLVGAPAQAQETAITLKSQQVTDQFPDGVLFEATAETTSGAEIKEIKLEMKVKGSNRSSYAYLTITPAATVEGKYLLKTSGAQYKPPGTAIEYRYVITDSEQRVLETPTETHLYLDSRFEWSHVSEGMMEVYYYGPVKTRAELILKAGAQTIDKVGSLLGIKVTEPVRVMAYNSARDLIPAQPFTSQTSERELLLEGVTFREYGTLLMIIGLDRPDGIASHEITHVLAGRLTTNALAEVPAWLDEGLAEYGNINRDPGPARLLAQAIEQNRLLPLRNMQAPPGISSERLLMYGHGYAVVKYMVETYGEDKFRVLFAAFNKGQRVNEALQSVYGFDQDGLDDAWRASLGLPPVEKAEPAAPAQPAEPSTPSVPVESKGAGFNFTPIIVIAGVAVVAIIVVVVMVSRTKPRAGGPSG